MSKRHPALIIFIALAALAAACSGGGGDKTSQNTLEFATRTPVGSAVAGTAGPLALSREQRLMVRERDGSERVLLRSAPSTFPSFPMWSPDGTRIAYVQASLFTGQANADWGGDIYVVEAAGGPPQLVWKHDQPGAQVQGLAWTPDGKALLFGYYLTLIKDGKYQGQVQRLERLEIDGGKHTPLIDGAMFPSLSRDGTRLAYMTQDVNGQGGLWVSAPDGSGAVQLVEIGAQFLAILAPRIAPDGSAIAFAAVAGQAAVPNTSPGAGPRNAAHGVPMEVWRVEVADRFTRRLTNFKEDEPYPGWAPDGKTLIVLATGGLYEVNPTGSGVTKRIGEGAFGGQVDVR